MIRVAGEGTDGLAWLESDSRFHGPVGSGRVGVGRRSEGASAKAMPATALNAPWRSASLATVSTSGERLPSLVLDPKQGFFRFKVRGLGFLTIFS